jgi:hypothetical protein
MDDLRWRPTSKLAYATRKARGSAGRNLRNDRFWRQSGHSSTFRCSLSETEAGDERRRQGGPSALAVLRLTVVMNLVACSTGMSLGFAPLRISATKRWHGKTCRKNSPRRPLARRLRAIPTDRSKDAILRGESGKSVRAVTRRRRYGGNQGEFEWGLVGGCRARSTANLRQS